MHVRQYFRIHIAVITMPYLAIVTTFFAATLLLVSNLYASVQITEFMASNEQTLTDDDGDYSDWIELYNSGTDKINLAGWHLTDDGDELDKWDLPSLELAAGEHLLVYASGKDRATSEGIHTNFKLSKGGEYLGLVQPDGFTVEYEYAPMYSRQIDDVSYGILGNGTIGFIKTPTPGAGNSPQALPEVTISAESTTFTGNLTLTLRAERALADTETIRYTLDGSTPTSSSTAYIEPFNISTGADVKAGVFSASETSVLTSGRYIEYDSSLIGFESSLPLVVIDTRQNDVSGDGINYTPTSIAILGNADGTARLASTPDYVGYAGARVRGSSSARFPKKSYRIEFWDDAQQDQNVDLLSLGEDSDWVLIAPGFMDRSLIANPLMSDLARDIGLPSMQWRYVELFLNSDDETVSLDDYQGIYLLFETIKIDEERINIADLSASDATEPQISGGFILKRDRADSDELSFLPGAAFDIDVDPINQVVVHRPKLDDLTTVQQDWIHDYVRDFESALLSGDSLSANSDYRAFVEENSWIDMHILDLLSMDGDLLNLSNYFYKDRGSRLVNGPAWDFDRSLNSADWRDDNPSVVNHPRQVDPFGFSWWGSLFDIEHFDEKYRRRWHSLRQGPLSNAALFARVDTTAAPLFEPYPREHARWGEGSDTYGSRYGDSSNYQGEIDALKEWLAERLTFLDAYLSDPGPANCTSTTLDYTLVKGIWAMLSLPCVPPAGESLGTIFGDDIPGTYGIDWTVYILDPAIGPAGDYVELSADDLPAIGQGFWIIQVSKALAVLDMPAGSLPLNATSSNAQCAAEETCTSVSLTAQSRWMLLGNPLRSALPIGNLRIIDRLSGPCSESGGCDLESADQADILLGPLYTYSREISKQFHTVASTGMIDSWSAFWVFAGPAAGSSDQVMLIKETLPSVQ